MQRSIGILIRDPSELCAIPISSACPRHFSSVHQLSENCKENPRVPSPQSGFQVGLAGAHLTVWRARGPSRFTSSGADDCQQIFDVHESVAQRRWRNVSGARREGLRLFPTLIPIAHRANATTP
jgi:hypothetical protein